MQRGSKSLSRTFSFTVPGWWNDLPIPHPKCWIPVNLQATTENSSLSTLLDFILNFKKTSPLFFSWIPLLAFINCKPFYSPREICSFILVSVYIPPQAHVSSALQKLADLITDTEQKHPDSVLIILGELIKQISSVWTAKIQTAHYMSHQRQ